jgi:hypothetical protein
MKRHEDCIEFPYGYILDLLNQVWVQVWEGKQFNSWKSSFLVKV